MASYALTATDTFATTDAASTNMTAVGDVTETLDVADLAEAIKMLVDEIIDTVDISEQAVGTFEGGAQAADTFDITDAIISTTAIFVVLTEEVSFTELVTPNAILNAFVTDGLSVVAILTVGGEEYVVWVANADTFAHSQYAHFNFNSMCRLGNQYYGANEDGIFLLEGEDDAGEDIQYFVTLPTTEFGHSGLKRIPRAYMGFSNSGDMHLKIITAEGREYVYRLNAAPAGQTEALTKIGRGIVSRYFTFDLYNYEGGEVELERMEFFPLYMRRLF